MELQLPSLHDIRNAHQRISPYIHRTLVLKSRLVNEYMGAEFYFKCENFQSVGAFKFRGATNAVMQLSPEESKHGVGTHSSGNHAAALARAAAMRNIPAYIVMPESSPEVKKKAVAGYGAKICFCKPTLEARESTMEEVIQETGCTFIHPYNRFDIIAGQGTAALEFLEEIPELDIIIAPVGGGGLISGTSICAKGVNPDIRVWAGEPEGADDAYRSVKEGRILPSVNPKTIADGLLTSLGTLTFKAISENVDEIRLCSEKNIVKAMRLIWERMKIIVEPSSAVPLGALMQNPGGWKGKRIGIIISGGNVELSDLPFKTTDI
jgi:threonine dehydratase